MSGTPHGFSHARGNCELSEVEVCFILQETTPMHSKSKNPSRVTQPAQFTYLSEDYLTICSSHAADLYSTILDRWTTYDWHCGEKAENPTRQVVIRDLYWLEISSQLSFFDRCLVGYFGSNRKVNIATKTLLSPGKNETMYAPISLRPVWAIVLCAHKTIAAVRVLLLFFAFVFG